MAKRKQDSQQVLDGWVTQKLSKSKTKGLLVSCPVCNKLVALQFVDSHLELECQKQQERAGLSYTPVLSNKGSCSEDKAQLVVAYGARNRRKYGLNAEQLQALVPCSVVMGVLGREMAEELLQSMYDKAQQWERGTWWMFGQQRTAPRASAYYLLTQHQDEQKGVEDEQMSSESSNEIKVDETPDVLLRANEVIQEKVNEFENGKNWKPTYILANYYKDGQDSVGQHSDRITRLGPRPIIASLSLGASRVFRVRQPKQISGCEYDYIDIPLAHNTLVVMWQGMQEEWLHEVPKSTNIKTMHPISGPARINLTFRQLKSEWQNFAPKCRCGRQSIMKTKPCQENQQQESFKVLETILPRGIYFYMCDNTQGPGCGFFKKLEVLAQEKQQVNNTPTIILSSPIES
eukprot:TRINITY_DN12965_c0_g1_i1.p1 TRINITY_DN12965_c0_g1~~TRINITY_DN12965_c0_g1_i1.p1  ORF type:complete len:403 (+),score=52.52 TRINITY_DN12965_c0_g1_i1:34-1242(+)